MSNGMLNTQAFKWRCSLQSQLLGYNGNDTENVTANVAVSTKLESKYEVKFGM